MSTDTEQLTAVNGKTSQEEIISYSKTGVVGNGSFGVVYEIKLQPSGTVAAVKRVLQDRRFKNRELSIMKVLNHPNIVELLYFFFATTVKDEVYLNLILDFVPETLYRSVSFYTSKRLNMPPLEVKLYTYQMFRALAYIHSMDICHRDIKPQNLLVNPSTGQLKLADFGSAKMLKPTEANVSYICSRYYRAPELIFGATNYTTKIDVWSSACVVAEMILGQPLFPGESGIDQLVEIIKILGTPSKKEIESMNPNYSEHRFPSIKSIPLTKIFKKSTSDCIAFISKGLQYSPLERISCIEALADPYFDELRNQSTKLPNYRKIFSQQFHNSSSNYQLYNGQPDLRDLPELFDFDDRELSIAPHLNKQIVPTWALPHLRLNQLINNLDDFRPMTPNDMKITLE
ncbi:GSK1 Glycogen synthase kinase 1 [Candida maltosa Xu316]